MGGSIRTENVRTQLRKRVGGEIFTGKDGRAKNREVGSLTGYYRWGTGPATEKDQRPARGLGYKQTK